MSPTEQDFMHKKYLEFIGAVTASLSHDVNNVLAIIRETAGLLEDYAYAQEQGRAPDQEKQKQATGRIGAQTVRGAELVGLLNRFAHSMNMTDQEFNAVDAFNTITALCLRFAVLKKAQLRTLCKAEEIFLKGRSIDLMHLVYRCIELALMDAKPGAGIDAVLEEEDGGARVLISCTGCGAGREGFKSKAAFIAKLAELNASTALVKTDGNELKEIDILFASVS